VNRAPEHALLRVPGVGARNVDRIIALRRLHGIRLDDLARLRVVLRKAVIKRQSSACSTALRDVPSGRRAPRHVSCSVDPVPRE
jgi:predicted DNA-binding helix-hairpin-helix protein